MNKLLTLLAVTVLPVTCLVAESFAQSAEGEQVIADFEDDVLIGKISTTHRSNVMAVDDVPEGGDASSARTTVHDAAGAAKYFGTGFRLPAQDLSSASEIRFWIKTDIKSSFNFQIHSEDSCASVFRFSTGESDDGIWKEIVAPLSSFTTPSWSREKADWTRVNKVQLTAFGGGPYDGKFIAIDNVVGVGKAPVSEPAEPPSTTPTNGPVKRGGPVRNVQKGLPSESKSPPVGFRSLFDGKTLNGWKAYARLPVPTYPGAPMKWRLEGAALETAKKNVGRWTIEDGAIVGGQHPPGSGKGAYLVSDETFGDFELMMDMNPDWKTDSGFLVRTLPGGSPGMQVLVDHRPQGGIGGFYGNGVAGIHGMPFAINAEYDAAGNPIRMIAADPDDQAVELNQKTRDILDYAANVEDFLKAWKWGQWNTVKVRCEGRIPTLTTWVNDVKIAVLDMNAITWENYDAEACAEMLGRKGHISLEVHNNNFNHWLGKDRWWPGAVVRWKNIYIRELD